MNNYILFVAGLERSFINDNNFNGPKNKEEIVALHADVKYIKTHVNHYTFEVDLTEVSTYVTLVTNCVLVMHYNKKNKRYYIEVYVAEEALVDPPPKGGGSFEKRIFKKNYEYIKSVLITRDPVEAHNFLYNGKPVWPDREKTNILYPSFIIPNYKMVDEGITPKGGAFSEREIIEEKDMELINMFTTEVKKSKKKKNKLLSKEKQYIKKYGKFDREEGIKILNELWNTGKSDLRIRI